MTEHNSDKLERVINRSRKRLVLISRMLKSRGGLFTETTANRLLVKAEQFEEEIANLEMDIEMEIEKDNQ